MENQESFINQFNQSENDEERKELLKKISDQDFLQNVVQTETDIDIRIEAVGKIEDPQFLESILTRGNENTDLCRAAIWSIKDLGTLYSLQNIANNDPSAFGYDTHFLVDDLRRAIFKAESKMQTLKNLQNIDAKKLAKSELKKFANMMQELYASSDNLEEITNRKVAKLSELMAEQEGANNPEVVSALKAELKEIEKEWKDAVKRSEDARDIEKYQKSEGGISGKNNAKEELTETDKRILKVLGGIAIIAIIVWVFFANILPSIVNAKASEIEKIPREDKSFEMLVEHAKENAQKIKSYYLEYKLTSSYRSGSMPRFYIWYKEGKTRVEYSIPSLGKALIINNGEKAYVKLGDKEKHEVTNDDFFFQSLPAIIHTKEFFEKYRFEKVKIYKEYISFKLYHKATGAFIADGKMGRKKGVVKSLTWLANKATQNMLILRHKYNYSLHMGIYFLNSFEHEEIKFRRGKRKRKTMTFHAENVKVNPRFFKPDFSIE